MTDNKQADISYKIKRLVDSDVPDGEGDFFMLKQNNQLNVDSVITQFRPVSGNGVIEQIFLNYNFQDKKVIDLVMFKKITPDRYRIYFILFMTE